MTENPEETLRRGHEADLRERLAALDTDGLGALDEALTQLRRAADRPVPPGVNAAPVQPPTFRLLDVLTGLGLAEHARRLSGDVAVLDRWLAAFYSALGDLDEAQFADDADALPALAAQVARYGQRPVVLVLDTLRELLIDRQRASRRTGHRMLAVLLGLE